MARKPAALARELLRNFPKGRRGKGRRRRKAAAQDGAGVGKEQTDGAPLEVEGQERDSEQADRAPAEAGDELAHDAQATDEQQGAEAA